MKFQMNNSNIFVMIDIMKDPLKKTSHPLSHSLDTRESIIQCTNPQANLYI